jgi:hypothetical protein
MRHWALPAAAALLAGCVVAPQVDPKFHGESEAADAARCGARDNDGDCVILVDVARTADGGCRVAVRADQEVVGFARRAKDKWIFWKIDSAPAGEFVFVKNGIAPKADTRGWADNFKNPRALDGGRTYRWKNTNDERQAGAEYRYEVRVVDADGVACRQDPIIRNQM